MLDFADYDDDRRRREIFEMGPDRAGADWERAGFTRPESARSSQNPFDESARRRVDVDRPDVVHGDGGGGTSTGGGTGGGFYTGTDPDDVPTRRGPTPGPTSTSSSSPGLSPHYYAKEGRYLTEDEVRYIEQYIKNEAAQRDSRLFDPSDVAGFLRNVGYQGNDNGASAPSLEEQFRHTHDTYDRRHADPGRDRDNITDPGLLAALRGGSASSGGSSSGGGSGSSAGAAGGSGGGGGAGASGSPFQNTAPLFDDPASRLLEDYALDQFGRRMNPDPNSGTALFEKYARELIDTLRQPAYSPQDEAIIKTRATDAIEQERTATKRRWVEELSRRGIHPSSGVALDGLLRIDNHFNGLRTTVEREFASMAIDTTRANRLQVLDTAGRLSDAEESRLREAGTYARVPYDLQERAFARNLQLVNAGGSPAELTNSALGIAGFLQNNARLRETSALDRGRFDLEKLRLGEGSALDRARYALALAQAGGNHEIALRNLDLQEQAIATGNRQALTSGLLQYLGYLFG